MRPGDTGMCPHCGVTVVFACACWFLGTGWQQVKDHVLASHDGADQVSFSAFSCPACNRVSLELNGSLVHPRVRFRRPPPDMVPEDVRRDFGDACVVAELSPKASAALSRRCLQRILEDKATVTTGASLATQIEQALEGLPAYLQPELDHVRVVGNFAAHPIKSDRTGEIVDVEPEEAEYNLHVIE